MNVILMIGDGMGLTQVSSIYQSENETVHFERFNHVGLLKTSSSREKVTDSAASATAYSAGIKTYNGAIGVNDDEERVDLITERIRKHDVKSGLIATSSITHATPAAFYAHVASRNMHERIAYNMPTSSIDFFAGGGLKYFTVREDNINIYRVLERTGFVMDSTSLNPSSTLSTENKYGYLLAQDALPRWGDGRGDFLVDASLRAIEYLSMGPNGFFLMVEGSQIDWGGHDNDFAYLSQELNDFNKAIGASLDFAEAHGNTLVLVTADHETGGLALPGGDTYQTIQPTFSTGGHTATMIPILAFGPGAESFGGIYENNELYHKVLAVTGW